MKNVKMLVSASILSVASAYAVAESYVGASYLDGGLELMDSIDADLPGAFIRIGNQYGDHLAAEIRGGIGVGKEHSIAGSDVDFELEDFYGAYVLLKAPSHSYAVPYLIAGYTRAEFKADGPGGSSDTIEEGFSYGAGLSIELTEAIALNGEWIQYVNKSDIEFSGLSMGVSMEF